jgi:DNA-binding response OmpR family regulator
LRRARAGPAEPDILSAADVTLDLTRHTTAVAGQAVELTPTEFELLRALIGQPGRAFSRMELLDATQGEAYDGYERTIDAHIKNLRGKIEPDPRNPRYILTVYGVGYKFSET